MNPENAHAARPPATWNPQRITFNRDDGLPKYIAIARALSTAITENELRPGEPLPSQKELAESFGVTVMTVRQAIRVLTERHLLSAEQGKGTYVSSQPFRLPLGHLASFSSQIKASGRTLRTEVLSFEPIGVSPVEQRRMSLETPDAFELTRLRFVDGEPLILQTSLLPRSIAERIDPNSLASRALYDVLQADLGIRISRATETLQAINLDAASAALLRRSEGEAAMLSHRLTFDANETAVLDDRALTAGDGVVISSERRMDDLDLRMVFSSGNAE